jgi:hypothetical protein
MELDNPMFRLVFNKVTNIVAALFCFGIVSVIALSAGCQKKLTLKEGTNGYSVRSVSVNGKPQTVAALVVPSASKVEFVMELSAPKAFDKPTSGIVNLLQKQNESVVSLQSSSFKFEELEKGVFRVRFSLVVPEYSNEALLQVRDTQKVIAEVNCNPM